jgi:hypothetical protein
MWTPYSIKTRRPVSVVLDIENIDSDVLADQLMVDDNVAPTAAVDLVEPRLRIEFARREIALRYPEYEAALFGKDQA